MTKPGRGFATWLSFARTSDELSRRQRNIFKLESTFFNRIFRLYYFFPSGPMWTAHADLFRAFKFSDIRGNLPSQLVPKYIVGPPGPKRLL